MSSPKKKVYFTQLIIARGRYIGIFNPFPEYWDHYTETSEYYFLRIVYPNQRGSHRWKGRLLCSYPGPAIAVPTEIVNEEGFCQELASFLSQMNLDVPHLGTKSKKAGVQVVEERESVYPRYITQLLTEILRGMGAPAEVTHIRKWIAGDVLWDNALKPSETLSHVAPHSRGATNFAIPRDQNSYRIQDIYGVLYGSVAAVSIIDRASEQYTLLPESESRQQTL